MQRIRNTGANALSFDTVEDSQTSGEKAVHTGDYGHRLSVKVDAN